MSHTKTSGTFAYGRKLVDASISGIRHGQKELDPRKTSELLTTSAEESFKLAMAGACLGVVPAVLLTRRSRATNAMVFGVIGSVLGFVASFSWKTRGLTASLAHSAAHEVRRVQDEHWLEVNPIDYA